MKFLFLAKSESNPATRYRAQFIIDALRRRGDQVDVYYEPGIFLQLQVLIKSFSADLVFVQRKLFSLSFLDLLARCAKKIVFDFDDAIFLRSDGEVSPTRMSRFEKMVAMSDCILAGNRYLAESARALSDKVHLIPTCLDVNRYLIATKKDPLVTLVWIGSASTSRYLEFHRDKLEALGRAFPELRLKIIGDFEFEMEHLTLEIIPWTQSTEVVALVSSHIGIAPMTDDLWTRGKCALKIIQYMAAGLPVVTSRVGANKEVVVDGQTGYLVDSQEEWVDAIGRLIDSDSLRIQMGEQGRLAANRQYSQLMVTEKVLGLLDKTLSG
jgi:glycosyltransferase involved in cell wall biosynthesis